jgi:uncharacterized damage-inducible protein DinB
MINMDPKLTSVYNRLEKTRRDLLQLVSSIPEETFYFAPEGKWSISQILVHLIQAEKLSLQYMKKKSLGIEQAGDTGAVEDLKYFFLTISQRLPLKYKAPKVLGEKAPDSFPLSDTITKWDNFRAELKSFLDTIDSKHLKRKIYKHAVAGRLNVLHAVDFFTEHMQHHLPQIQKLIKAKH